jgi:hypothetical protein
MSEIYVCDRCAEEVEFSEVGYLGNGTDNCSPFIDLDCYCINCVDIYGEPIEVDKNEKGH